MFNATYVIFDWDLSCLEYLRVLLGDSDPGDKRSLRDRSVGIDGFVNEFGFADPLILVNFSKITFSFAIHSPALSLYLNLWFTPFFLQIPRRSDAQRSCPSPLLLSPLLSMHPTAAILYTFHHDVTKTCADFLFRTCDMTSVRGFSQHGRYPRCFEKRWKC